MMIDEREGGGGYIMMIGRVGGGEGGGGGVQKYDRWWRRSGVQNGGVGRGSKYHSHLPTLIRYTSPHPLPPSRPMHVPALYAV
jgi:hypothetical protein